MPSIKSIFIPATAALVLAGCTISDGGMNGLIDDTITTGSISKAPAAAAPSNDLISDNRTVRNAVSAADIHTVEAQPLPWANAETGTRGEITAITEIKGGGQICRLFKTSRQRFDGIALYNGEACTNGAGEWTLTRFAEEG
ncbi:RT0821/Lpp0805 family surface protein [Consotaella aegiceratis]|uniref:RT0821/Lpp0805 family surface protein n=1 Tax=Consotaella aegiceratis TaxID=3097961 RepID=UPI002F4159EB